MPTQDFLEQMIDKRTARNPEFPKLLKAIAPVAVARKAPKAKPSA